MSQFTKESVFVVTSCINTKCGFQVGLPKDFIDNCKRIGGGYNCPVCGQGQGWWKSDADRLKEQLASKEAELKRQQERARRAEQDADYFKNSRNAYKGQVTKLKNRAANGVCPCCNRYFANLHRHMQTKHPDFKNEEGE